MSFENLNMRNQSKESNIRPADAGRTTLIGNTVLNAPEINHDALPLITFRGVNGTFSMSSDQLSRGALLIGSTGAGKTTIFMSAMDQIIPKMTTSDIMFVFDSKGDFLNRYYRNKNESVVISVKEEHSDIAKSWNVFGELFDESGSLKSADIFAKEISKALFKGMESSTQPFFHIAASDIFAVVLSCFCKEAEISGDYSRLNNEELVNFINRATIQDYYNLTNKYPQYRYIQSYLGNPNSTTTQALGILGYLYGMINSIFVGCFRKNCTNGQFSVRRLMREKGKKIIFVEYDVLLGDTLGPIYSLLYDLAVKEALSLGKGNTYVIVDEANLLPHCRTFQDLVNFGRSRGCKTMVGLQSINQLYNNYGNDEGKSIASGFVNMFCLNSVDYETREFISKRFGETYENVAFGGANYQRNGRTVEDSDIHNLSVGEAFVDLSGYKPFKFKFKNIS